MKDKRIEEINEILCNAKDAMEYAKTRALLPEGMMLVREHRTMKIKAEAFDKINAIMSGVKEENWWEK